jgi:hypothetical protein
MRDDRLFWLMRFAVLLAAAWFLLGIEYRTATAAPQVLSIPVTACQADGNVSASFSWTPKDAYWLDISLTSDFAQWENAWVKGVSSPAEHLTWKDLSPGTTYFARTGSPSTGGWLHSNVVQFTTPSCLEQGAPGAPMNLKASNLSCWSSGGAQVTFTWVSPRTSSQWFDISTDPDFAGWENRNLGPAAYAYIYGPLQPDTTYYARISVYANGVWLRSNVVAFHTLVCPRT